MTTDNDTRHLGTSKREVSFRLSTEEKGQRGIALAELNMEIETLERVHRGKKRQMGQRLKAMEQRRSTLSEALHEGVERRQVACDVVACYDDKTVEWRHDGKVVHKRAMTAEELQGDLFEADQALLDELDKERDDAADELRDQVDEDRQQEIVDGMDVPENEAIDFDFELETVREKAFAVAAETDGHNRAAVCEALAANLEHRRFLAEHASK